MSAREYIRTINTAEMKSALVGITGCKRLLVRKGSGSQANAVLVYLPKSIRLTGRLAAVLAFCETYYGLTDSHKARTIPGPIKAAVSIQPIYEQN